MKDKEKSSFSRVILISAACCIVIIALLAWFIFVFDRDDSKISYSEKKTISVSEGAVQSSSSFLGTFTVPADNQYLFSVAWMPESMDQKDLDKPNVEGVGFVTILALFNAKNEVIYATSANVISLDTTLFLDAGDYQLIGYHVTRESDFVEHAKEYLCSSNSAAVLAREIDFSALGKDGAWTMKYTVNAVPVGFVDQARITGVALGLLLGLCFVFILLAAGNKRHRLESPQYDERQELERGRGFRYAFFTFLIFDGLMLCLDFTQLISTWASPFLHTCGLFLGVTVYVVYCIWHESYFALNEKPRTLMIIFLVIALLNLGISILHFVNGNLIKDGHFSYCIVNLICFLMFFVLFIAMFLKKKLVSRSADSADDDEEE